MKRLFSRVFTFIGISVMFTYSFGAYADDTTDSIPANINSNDILEKYKSTNFFLTIHFGSYSDVCEDYTVSVDSMSRGIKNGDVNFVYRSDEADKSQHTLVFTCPLIAKGEIIYNLLSNGNLELYVDKCSVKKDMQSKKIGQNVIDSKNKEDLCIFYPASANITLSDTNKVSVDSRKIVLANKLGFNSFLQATVIGFFVFVLSLGAIIKLRGFEY